MIILSTVFVLAALPHVMLKRPIQIVNGQMFVSLLCGRVLLAMILISTVFVLAPLPPVMLKSTIKIVNGQMLMIHIVK